MGRGNLITLIIFGILIIVLPVAVTSPYYLRVINFAGIFTLICIGLSLLLGYAGQISIGQAGFFAIGAYSSGILTAQFGYSPWFGILVGIAINSLVAFLVGIPTLKLRGHYLAMATLGIGEIIHIITLADTEDFTKLIQFLGEKVGYRLSVCLQPLSPFGPSPAVRQGSDKYRPLA